MNWTEIVAPYKNQLIQDLTSLLEIPSVRDDHQATAKAPFGPAVRQALDFMLELGQRDNFLVKNVGNISGHIEVGQGEKLFGVLGHVDVVPAPVEGWYQSPFKVLEKDGWLIARGTLDDKGPTMAAYYAIKILNDLKVTWNQRIRLIIGTDEESTWQCVEKYFEQEEMPDFGFAPDADFPLIYAEKGISTFDLLQATSKVEHPVLLSFQAGDRYNMVPDHVEAVLQLDSHIEESFLTYLSDNQYQGQYTEKDGQQILILKGKSVHAMAPELGSNAPVNLAKYLMTLPLDSEAKKYCQFICDYFAEDTFGEKLNIAYTDEEMGAVTVNAAVFNYTYSADKTIGINLRYPVRYNFQEAIDKLNQTAQQFGLSVANLHNQEPHYTDINDNDIQTLLQTYRDHSGDMTAPKTIGGGTYARALKKGVAFGALFPDCPDTMHQINEAVRITDIIKTTEIYADALYRLCTVEGSQQ